MNFVRISRNRAQKRKGIHNPAGFHRLGAAILRRFRVSLILSTLTILGAMPLRAQNPVIGNHPAVYNAAGILLPWTSWTDALTREMNWYFACPVENGYPRFVVMTFMDGNYEAVAKRPDFI